MVSPLNRKSQTFKTSIVYTALKRKKETLKKLNKPKLLKLCIEQISTPTVITPKDSSLGKLETWWDAVRAHIVFVELANLSRATVASVLLKAVSGAQA